jgi:hypothetical protein
MSRRLQRIFEAALLKQSTALKDFEFERPRWIGPDVSIESAASLVLAFYELAANKVLVGAVEVGFWISAKAAGDRAGQRENQQSETYG